MSRLRISGTMLAFLALSIFDCLFVWTALGGKLQGQPVGSEKIPSGYRDTITGMEFVFVKGGCFKMGDTFGDGYFAEKPVRLVCLDDFYIGKYEVTRGQWNTIMGDGSLKADRESLSANSTHKAIMEGDRYNASFGDSYPAGSLSYDDVQDFIRRFNKRTGKQYRLPTEAEWEYACRSGGKKQRFAGFSGVSDLYQYANFCDASCQHDWMTRDQDDGYREAAPVGSYKPNGLGLYDMSGNVWEWVADWFDPVYYEKSLTEPHVQARGLTGGRMNNPKGPHVGSERAIRGGCWLSSPPYLRCSYRLGFPATFREKDIGFRLVTEEGR